MGPSPNLSYDKSHHFDNLGTFHVLFSVPESPFSLFPLVTWNSHSRNELQHLKVPGCQLLQLVQATWGNMNTQKPHGQRSLAAYGPWGHTDLDRTEHACAHTHTGRILPCLSSGPESLAGLPSLPLSVLGYFNIYYLKILAMLCKRNREKYISILFQNRNHWINICQVEAKTWIQPKCPLTKERMKTTQYMYTMECYSAIRRMK